jgi:hypothetical protein
MKNIVKLGIAAKGSYAYDEAFCLRHDHVMCGWSHTRY